VIQSNLADGGSHKPAVIGSSPIHATIFF